MRIAIAGKGGAGKTTIAATLARLLARRGFAVVAVDGDSNPNLATALGIDAAAAAGAFLPSGLVSRRQTGPALTTPVDEILDRHAATGADGVRLVLMGMPAHAGEGCLCSAHATVSAVLADFEARPDAVAVVDMEASPEHLSRGTTRHVDQLVLVTEPYYRSLETVRRLAELARELPIPRVGVVANKVRHDDDAAAVAEFCQRHGVDMVACIPRRDGVVDADIARVPLLDYVRREAVGDASDVVEAIGVLAGELVPSAATGRAATV